jgi:hypothetical protein
MEQQDSQLKEIETNPFGETEYRNKKHTVAIIPLQIHTNYAVAQYPECLFSVRKNITALEKTVVQAMKMGVDSIWLVCKPRIYRLMRRKIPEYVIDDIRTEASIISSIKRIPIILVPMRDRYARVQDSVVWSYLYGATVAYKSCASLSQHMIPDTYLFMTPHTMLSDKEIEKFRPLTMSAKTYIVSHDNKTALDNELLPFNLSYDEIKRCKEFIRKDMVSVNPVLNKAHADYYFKKLTIDYVLKNANLDSKPIIPVEKYIRTDSWVGFKRYLASEMSSEPVFLDKRTRMYWIKKEVEIPKKFGYIFKEKEKEYMFDTEDDLTEQ